MAELAEGPRKRLMERRAVEYLDLAFRYAIQFARPTLWVMCGMPGTGKSTCAERVHEIFDIILLRSDEARKELPGYTQAQYPSAQEYTGQTCGGTSIHGCSRWLRRS